MGWDCDGEVAMSSCILPSCLHVARDDDGDYIPCTHTVHALTQFLF